MDESILKTIKSMLNIEEDISDFDQDLIVLINSSLSTLYQLGIGTIPFKITGTDETWSQLLDGKEYYLESAKELIYIDVKLVFDPPLSSMVMDAYKERRAEDQWRIAAQVDMEELSDSTDSGVGRTIDYNDLKNLPTLNGVTLKGDVQMDITVENGVIQLPAGAYVDGGFKSH